MSFDLSNDTLKVGNDGQLRFKCASYITGWPCSNPACSKFDDRDDPKFKQCSKCKCVSYCSRECQKKDWPSHKSLCNVQPWHFKFHQVHKNLMTNQMYKFFYQLLAIYKNGLHLLDDEALWSVRSKPLQVTLYVQYEPIKVEDTLRLLDMSSFGDETPMVGIPQIVAVSSPPESEMDKDDIELWKQCREEHEKPEGAEPPFILILQIRQMSGAQQRPNFDASSMTRAIILDDKSMTVARGLHPLLVPRPTRNSRLDVKNMVQYINECIRCDAQGRDIFRAPLPRMEKRMISLASFQPPDGNDATAISLVENAVGDNWYILPHPDGRMSVEVPPLTYIDCFRDKILRERAYRLAAERLGLTDKFAGLIGRDTSGHLGEAGHGVGVPEVPLLPIGLEEEVVPEP